MWQPEILTYFSQLLEFEADFANSRALDKSMNVAAMELIALLESELDSLHRWGMRLALVLHQPPSPCSDHSQRLSHPGHCIVACPYITVDCDQMKDCMLGIRILLFSSVDFFEDDL